MAYEGTCEKKPERNRADLQDGFDSVMELVGTRGKYQQKMVYVILSPICFVLGYNICQLLFQVAVPKYWCNVPGRENTSYSQEEWMALTIPTDPITEEFDSCKRYSSLSIINGTLELKNNQTESCTDGWDYDRRQFWSTVATSHEWYCERESYSSNILTINMAGNAVGTFLVPILTDKLGRRIIFYALLVVHIVFTLAYVWVPLYGLHLAFRFFRGFIELSIYFIPHVTTIEILDPEYRAKATTIGWAAWMLGMCVTSLIAWLMPDWQYLALSTVIPAILGFAYWNHFPESPRWLLSKGRITECTNVLFQIGEVNGKRDVTKKEIENRLKDLADQQEGEVSFTRSFVYPRLRWRALGLFAMSGCLYVVYGVTLFGINVLPDNQFLSHLILSFSEFPSNGLGLLLLHYVGRRATCYSTFSATALLCLVSIFCTHNQWLMMVMLALTKLFVTTALLVIYVVTSEIFPTPVRSSGLGMMSVCGLIAMAVAPSVINSGLGPTFQYWVMLAVMLFSLLTSLMMPETLGLPLPQTFQEAEEMGSGRPITTWVHHWNYHKFPGKRVTEVDPVATTEELKSLKTEK